MKEKVNKKGTLFVCATPIGNLEDCSYRLINTLHAVDKIAAEDTRVTRKLLKHYSINTPLIADRLSKPDKILFLSSIPVPLRK